MSQKTHILHKSCSPQCISSTMFYEEGHKVAPVLILQSKTRPDIIGKNLDNLIHNHIPPNS